MRWGMVINLDKCVGCYSCVITCPAKARYFGDLDQLDSEVSVLMRKWRPVQLHPEYGTDPSVYYVIG